MKAGGTEKIETGFSELSFLRSLLFKANSPTGTMKRTTLLVLTFTIANLASTALAQDEIGPLNRKVNYSPYPEKDFPNRVYFGDTHLHTSYSTDAGMIGNRSGRRRPIASLAVRK